MSIKKPYYRAARPFVNNSYSASGQSLYIRDPEYAKEPEQYIRAFLLIQQDLINLFDYIHASDTNLKCYSFRVHELLIRTCIEVEANLKAILTANGYCPQNKNGKLKELKMYHYRKIEFTHHLSGYQIKIPYWRGKDEIRVPFKNWATKEKTNPDWYNAYHATKHDRHHEFENANFENLLDAVCGLVVLLSSQFYTEDFSPANDSFEFLGNGQNDGMESAIGSYFRVKFPNFPDSEKYDFAYDEWLTHKNAGAPFQSINYDAIKLNTVKG